MFVYNNTWNFLGQIIAWSMDKLIFFFFLFCFFFLAFLFPSAFKRKEYNEEKEEAEKLKSVSNVGVLICLAFRFHSKGFRL